MKDSIRERFKKAIEAYKESEQAVRTEQQHVQDERRKFEAGWAAATISIVVPALARRLPCAPKHFSRRRSRKTPRAMIPHPPPAHEPGSPGNFLPVPSWSRSRGRQVEGEYREALRAAAAPGRAPSPVTRRKRPGGPRVMTLLCMARREGACGLHVMTLFHVPGCEGRFPRDGAGVDRAMTPMSHILCVGDSSPTKRPYGGHYRDSDCGRPHWILSRCP
jgi:hypothetical protein